VADVRSYIEGRFVIIVGDKELAEGLGVGHATVAEVICLTDSKYNNLNQLIEYSEPPRRGRSGGRV
jgi:hypothetical protein